MIFFMVDSSLAKIAKLAKFSGEVTGKAARQHKSLEESLTFC